MKQFILIIIFAGAVTTVNAQQLQTSSFYDMQGVIHNPSTAGSNGSMVGATYRSQCSGISVSTKTATVFGSFDIAAKHRDWCWANVYNKNNFKTNSKRIRRFHLYRFKSIK